LALLDERRRFCLMLDYEFGRGTSTALPRSGLDFLYSRRSDRLKQVMHDGKLFAVVRPNGAIALSLLGARILASSRTFMQNSVTVSDDAVQFVRSGKSVFCKFVLKTGRHVLPGGEVVVLDGRGTPIGVGRAKLPGACMREFKAGVAVKVRSAHE
jgi:7-cyano-7-deazaguanine tRNA-ribosyltransferase